MCSKVRLSPTVVVHVYSACEALMIYGYNLETPFWTGSPKVMTRSHVSRLIPKPISRAPKNCLGLNKYKLKLNQVSQEHAVMVVKQENEKRLKHLIYWSLI